MRIEAGVQFLFSKVPFYKDFPIPFNESRLYSNREMVAVEPFMFLRMNRFLKGLDGVLSHRKNATVLPLPFLPAKRSFLRKSMAAYPADCFALCSYSNKFRSTIESRAESVSFQVFLKETSQFFKGDRSQVVIEVNMVCPRNDHQLLVISGQLFISPSLK